MSLAPTALYLNGIDVAAAFGFVLDDVGSAFDTPERSDVLLELPQGVGSLLSDLPGRVVPRALQLSGTLPATTSTLLETAKDRLKALCADGLVEIRLVAKDVIWRGRLAGISMAHSAPQLRSSNAAARVTLRFLCPDPLAWARSPSVLGFTSYNNGPGVTPVSVPLGTAPSRGRGYWSAIITIYGAATTPILTEYDAAGSALRTMSFTGWSPTASDAIEVDLGRGLVTRVTAGVRSNGMADLAAGYAFPALDPADGDWQTSRWPRLSVSSGTASLRYYKAYR